MLTVGSRIYKVVLGSDVIRDGMYLELSEDGGNASIAEVLFSDETGKFVLNTYGNDVPLEAIEWLVSEARLSLPPQA